MEILYMDTRHIKKSNNINCTNANTSGSFAKQVFEFISFALKRGVFMHSCMYSSVRSGWTMGG